MRKFIALLLLVAILPLPIHAQEGGCDDALPPRLEIGQAGLVDVAEGFLLNLRAEASTSAEILLELNNGEVFQIMDGPLCADGLYWWEVEQFGVRGWVAESSGPSYMILPQNRPDATLPAPPIPTLAPVLLADQPSDLQTAVIDWDWRAFLEDSDSFMRPPDPLSLELPERYQGDLPDLPLALDEIRFLVDAGLNNAQRALLARNGFVVVPGDGDVFFDAAYQFGESWDSETGHSIWVSTDALLNALHVAFDNLLKFLETEDLHSRLVETIAPAYDAAVAQLDEVADSALETPARNAALFYAVALGLIDAEEYDSQVDAALREDADTLIEAALNAEGRLDVPFLNEYQEDFSQYQPRGHYSTSPESEAYFRTMMWLGRITFLARDDEALQSSLLVLRALDESGGYDSWAVISDLLGFLIGPTDNLGPAEYLPLAREIFGESLPFDTLSSDSSIDAFRAAVLELPGPRINNVVRPLGTQAGDLDSATRGFRLFGQRFTLDAYVMQRLIYPEVGAVGNERILPSGLDVAAAMGSDLAFQLLDERGDTAYANYVDHLGELRGDVSALNPTDWFQNVYGGWLWAMQPLWARDAEPYPPLMATDAWQRRDLQAGLASWAELKHDTILYVAQPMGGLGGGADQTWTTYGMVEPNPYVFARIAVIAASVHQLLRDDGFGEFDFSSNEPPPGAYYLRNAFGNLASLSAKLAQMSNKALWGEALNEEEELFLKYGFAGMLFSIRYSAEFKLDESAKPTMNATIADVASNVDAGLVLEVGTGEIDTLYVVTNSPDGLQVVRGAVFSYYEFSRDIDQRLTDADWRALLRSGEQPPRPDWIDEFYSE